VSCKTLAGTPFLLIGEYMKILIVSGFLGTGKTTFIKELIRRTGTLPVILENEYGENDLDVRELSTVGEMKILEFMEGCVCCTKKDSFVNSVLTISASLNPEYLVVEPTGVGKLGNILDNIRQISYEQIQLLRPVVVLTPRSFFQNLSDWPDIYKDQIKNAGIIVLSKVEKEAVDVIAKVVSTIKSINPEVEILSEHYTKMDTEWWMSLMRLEGELPPPEVSENTDEVEQITMKQVSLHNIGELVCLLEDILRCRFGNIVRSKGVLRVGDEMIRFDLADKLFTISGNDTKEAPTQCVFIGSDLCAKPLCERLYTTLAREGLSGRPHWKKKKPTYLRGKALKQARVDCKERKLYT
jgi:G3E family GTPase